jgi:hypothetical protein
MRIWEKVMVHAVEKNVKVDVWTALGEKATLHSARKVMRAVTAPWQQVNMIHIIKSIVEDNVETFQHYLPLFVDKMDQLFFGPFTYFYRTDEDDTSAYGLTLTLTERFHVKAAIGIPYVYVGMNLDPVIPCTLNDIIRLSGSGQALGSNMPSTSRIIDRYIKKEKFCASSSSQLDEAHDSEFNEDAKLLADDMLDVFNEDPFNEFQDLMDLGAVMGEADDLAQELFLNGASLFEEKTPPVRRFKKRIADLQSSPGLAPNSCENEPRDEPPSAPSKRARDKRIVRLESGAVLRF